MAEPSSAGPSPTLVSPLDHPLRWRLALPLLLVLIALPWIAEAAGEGFYVGVASRILIFAIAATSLNLILGFGGMVSFGHAAYLGVGAYTVGILADAGITSAWVAWPAAVAVSALAALVIGSISLRTRGVYFIMITLAFAQMLYFLMVSLKMYGGDDGLPLPGRSTVADVWNLADDARFYWTVLTLFVLVFGLVWAVVNSRFGHALQGMRDNESRMAALGYPVFRVQLAAFTLAGAVAGLAGALLANQNTFVSPAMLQWSQSGMLMIMVILGGVGHLYGALAGATVFLLLEELLAAQTVHWQLGLGAVLLAVVLLLPNGLLSLSRRWKSRSAHTRGEARAP